MTGARKNIHKRSLMSEDKQPPKLIKIGIVLYTLIFILIAVDIASDYGEGVDWAHISVELMVLFAAVVGITVLGREYYIDTQLTLKNLQIDLTQAQLEAQHWREESRDLIQGLGVEIQKQFKRWDLTQAESEIGLLILKGFSHQEIADFRQVSERTVREQARTLYRKAGLTGRSELSAFFLEDLLLPSA
jgi:DNA-binding CsgD family transcriptional regulator